MNTSTKRLIAVAALLGATLFASPTDAQKAGSQTMRKSLPLNIQAPTSVDVDAKDGRVVGMTAVMKDGRRKALKAQSKPTCATGCPAGKTLSCWEDEAEMMSICVCTGGGGGAGDPDLNFAVDSADFQF